MADPGFDLGGGGVNFVKWGWGRKSLKVLTLEVKVKILHVLALFLLKK